LPTVNNTTCDSTYAPVYAAPKSNAQAIFNDPSQWSSIGYAIMQQFVQAMYSGRLCYEGTLSKTGTAIVMRIYPMNSYGDVITFKEQLICVYKGQGYQTYQGNYLSGFSTRLKGISALAGTMVSIDMINHLIIRCSVTQEMRGNVEGIY
jgi:hypothetical protein